jgi:LAO/AO transport system kinase
MNPTNNKIPIARLIADLHAGEKKALARCITLVENELPGYEEILTSLKFRRHTPVIGITGPPGSGKSTFINGLLKYLTQENKKVAVIAVDPSSPFNYGSLLGDRIRMIDHFMHPDVFIRSLATRGSLGGLSVKALEITDVMRASDFDFILVETVGVGQSEVEIAGLADTTILLLVPEGGDEIQAIKSGIMEVADIIAVNKSDRPGADEFTNMLKEIIDGREGTDWKCPVLKIVALRQEGIIDLVKQIQLHEAISNQTKKIFLLSEKAFQLIQFNRMKDVDKTDLQTRLKNSFQAPDFNLYAFVKNWNL